MLFRSGHFSDTKRYFICEAFKNQYTTFSLRRKRANFQNETMKYFDETKTDLTKGIRTVSIVPCINEWFAFISAVLIEDRIYIDDVIFNKDTTESLKKSKELINGYNDVEIVNIEAVQEYLYLAREFRQDTEKYVRALANPTNKELRIEAQSDFIMANCYFKSGDDNSEYSLFIENLLDCMNKKSIEAANALVVVVEYFRRRHLNN